jgi:hypothetical protein
MTCGTCQQWVKAGEVHSCYSEFDWRRVAALERAVVEKAEAWAVEYQRVQDLHAEKEPSEAERAYHLKRVGDTSDALADAVEALRMEA